MKPSYTYKIDTWEPVETNDYVIRYSQEEYPKAYAKIKGRPEFETDFTVNNTAYEIYLGGREITKEEYDNF